MATKAATAQLRAKRKQQGLCIYCGDLAKVKQTRCQSCVDRDKANRKRWADRDSQRGICRNTGCANHTTDRKRYCDSCNARSTRNGAIREQRNMASGLCRDCGVQPMWEHRTRCKDCTKRLNKHSKKLQATRIAAGKCGRCGDYVLADGYKRCQKCIDEGRYRHRQNKLAALAAYGGQQCKHCGETNYWVLQIDHMNNNGHAHALSVGTGNATLGRSKMYRWLKERNYPDGFQVLCANCNIKKAHEGKSLTPNLKTEQ